jgi:prophage regulatory protein
MDSNTHLQRFPEFSARLGHCRSQIYNLIRNGLLMPPIRLSVRAVAWPSYETERYIAAVVRGASDAELRELVASLVAARTTSSSEASASFASETTSAGA